ncbi:MAG: hypothetical protein PUA72_03845 [Lachnospiraceae bacterium]|nr:hypothetical protein [Lachnospiraceae bacterium]
MEGMEIHKTLENHINEEGYSRKTEVFCIAISCSCAIISSAATKEGKKNLYKTGRVLQ